jgi:hypothetical protein
MKLFLRRLILLFLPLFLMACALGELIAGTAEPVTLPAGQSSPTPAGPELSLDAAAGGLTSYRVQMRLRFNGQDEQNQPIQSSLTFTDETNTGQPAQHLLVKTEANSQPPASFELYRLGGAAYLVSTEISSQAGCVRQDASQSAVQPVLGPGDIFQSVQRGELVQRGEAVNGFSADHYKLAGIRLGVGTPDTWDGDVWVAQPGDLVVRFSGWMEGQVTLTGQPGQGRLEWDYQVAGEEPLNITLAEDCSAMGLPDLPLPDDAQNLTQIGEQISFTSPTPATALVEFLRRSLPERGWTIEEEAGTGTLFALTAAKEGRALHVTVSAQDSGSKVTILLK